MIKIAMINIHNELIKQKLDTKMTMQVHDELVFDVPKTEVETVMPLVKELMQNAFKTTIPIVVETGVGSNWLEAH